MTTGVGVQVYISGGEGSRRLGREEISAVGG